MRKLSMMLLGVFLVGSARAFAAEAPIPLDDAALDEIEGGVFLDDTLDFIPQLFNYLYLEKASAADLISYEGNGPRSMNAQIQAKLLPDGTLALNIAVHAHQDTTQSAVPQSETLVIDFGKLK